MARKVFISVLGASNYGECEYCKDNESFGRTRFIQVSTLRMLTKDGEWSHDRDAAYILLTDEAEKRNWIDDGQINLKTNEPIPGEGLRTCLKTLEREIGEDRFPAVIPVTSLPMGNNETEIWEIFETVFSKIEDCDELYFDITHGFRYLPMLILVLGNYAKFLKNAMVKSITYGNYEVSDRGEKPAPIIDLEPLSQMQEWTTAAADFLQNGYVDKMSDLTNGSIRLLQKDEATRSDDNKKLNTFVKTLRTFVDERLTCRGLDICSGKKLHEIKEQADRLGEVVIKPLEPILEKITEALPEPGSSENNCLDAAGWCYDNHLYQQAATILEEGAVTFFCERHGIRINDEEGRKLINSAFIIKFKNLPPSEWDVDPDKMEKLTELLNDPLLSQPAVYNAFNNISETRNDYNHAGFRSKRDPQKPENIKKNIAKVLQSFRATLPGHYEAKVRARRVLVNLSNHPSASWSEEQKAAAQKYGEIVDIPFPDVLPTWSENEIENQAQEIVDCVMDAYQESEVTVHVMGEMTLTYNIVSLFKSRGIRCVASTSERIVKENSNGEKISLFHFVAFRDY